MAKQTTQAAAEGGEGGEDGVEAAQVESPMRPMTRAEAAKVQRTQRVGMTWQDSLKLSIPDHLRNDPNWRPYWALNKPGRIERLLDNGYVVVSSAELSQDARQTGLGTVVERHAGTNDQGAPLRHVLMMKKREYYDEDQREKAQQRAKAMDAIKRGKTAGADGKPIHGEKTYVPEAGISISHGDYTP